MIFSLKGKVFMEQLLPLVVAETSNQERYSPVGVDTAQGKTAD
jgi:hypothetical protein